ncbi:MAG: hypothetical protein HYU56_00060 [Candidatus Aenigmarchaeota archaeon]|nr:hypothetical protein [Candidatus Aenigmarchaeota archaeon]
MKIKDAQEIVKEFAKKNDWKDEPNMDKFDHLHEELIEMSRYLRYKNLNERKKMLEERKEIFEDGVGDLLFGILRLANQLDVDAEEAFELTHKKIIEKYNGKKEDKVL